jgi:hypothetical protein
MLKTARGTLDLKAQLNLNTRFGERSTVQRILWVGDDQREFGWLQSRIAKYRSTSLGNTQLLSWPDLNSIPIQGLTNYLTQTRVDRIVVACRNRWDYPQQQLEQLANEFPEIPLAVVMGDWFAGWRRTGAAHLQTLPYLVLAWYRWWDGWRPWLESAAAHMFGPFPQERGCYNFDPMMEHVKLTETTQLLPQTGMILAGCYQIEQAWGASINESRISERLTSGELTPGEFTDSPRVAWILWDDSRLSTRLEWPASLRAAVVELQQLRIQYPAAQIWTAWTLPTWEIIDCLQLAKLKAELLAKPHWICFSSAADART